MYNGCVYIYVYVCKYVCIFIFTCCLLLLSGALFLLKGLRPIHRPLFFVVIGMGTSWELSGGAAGWSRHWGRRVQKHSECPEEHLGCEKERCEWQGEQSVSPEEYWEFPEGVEQLECQEGDLECPEEQLECQEELLECPEEQLERQEGHVECQGEHLERQEAPFTCSCTYLHAFSSYCDAFGRI